MAPAGGGRVRRSLLGGGRGLPVGDVETLLRALAPDTLRDGSRRRENDSGCVFPCEREISLLADVPSLFGVIGDMDVDKFLRPVLSMRSPPAPPAIGLPAKRLANVVCVADGGGDTNEAGVGGGSREVAEVRRNVKSRPASRRSLRLADMVTL